MVLEDTSPFDPLSNPLMKLYQGHKRVNESIEAQERQAKRCG